MLNMILRNLNRRRSSKCCCLRILGRVLEKELNSTSNAFVTNACGRISEILEVDLLAGNRVKEMIQIFLEFESLVDVRSIVEESRRTENVVSLVVFSQSHVQFLHEELITERDESTWNFMDDDIIKESAFVYLVENLLVRIMSNSHIRVIASCNVESKEVLQREEWLVEELRNVCIRRLQTFFFHLRSTDADESVGIIGFRINRTHEVCGFQVMSRTACSNEDCFSSATKRASS